MMGQFIFFVLFIVTLFAGVSVFFSPRQQVPGHPPIVRNNNDDEMAEEIDTKEFQKLNMTTINGIVQIRRQMDDLTSEQKKLIALINEDQQSLNNTDQEINAVLKQINGKNDLDVLKLKALGLELQNNQRLLIDRGQSLIAFNNQLNKNRLWLVKQNELLNFNNEASLRLLQDHDASLNDQSAALFDKVAQQNNDIMDHTQELIDKEHQKVEDQQSR